MGGKSASTALAIAIVLLIALPVLELELYAHHREEVAHDTRMADASIEWWFDETSKAVCWNGMSFGTDDFRIDLDGNHGTSVTSRYSGFPTFLLMPLSGMYDTQGSIRGVNGAASLLSEQEVNPPIPHFREYYAPNDTWSEWYHVFVTKLDPPTDWVLGMQRSDGSTIFPLTDPFWYTEDEGSTWQVFDPSTDSKGNRTCREDFPDVNVQVHLDIDPDTLNLKSKGRWITAYLSAENASVHDIDISTILLQDTLSPERWDYQDDILMLKFDRQEFKDTVQVGESVQVKITGKWEDGTAFEEYDGIRVIEPGKG